MVDHVPVLCEVVSKIFRVRKRDRRASTEKKLLSSSFKDMPDRKDADKHLARHGINITKT